jgi:hypothetical protein
VKITTTFLKEKNACSEELQYVIRNNFIGLDRIDFLKKLMGHDKYQWANWLIVRTMTKPQYVAYAIFAAEQVIDIFEKKYPDDKRPRKAIDAAKKWLKNRTDENAAAADAAAAAYAAYAAYAADDAAAYAAAYAAYAADAAAAYAAYAADAAAAYAAARKEMQAKILNYGITLLEKGE